ncbi:hypothetical protein HPP92_006247 [Vanilla planifolia]|uniref:Response regulatory domain-containing protein n=1 Tax=Vanilla planifolia TaxID=51239 RepID=A0A835RR64_VANPL|nr:hypothetical protein HPP92_006531 [Vanilla planifolia]KAG0495253.1 hypothetical protein HPP92_006247 [Vanilla planifolia]
MMYFLYSLPSQWRRELRFEATRQIRLLESEANEQIRTRDSYLNNSEGSPSPWHLPILAMTVDVIQATYEECLKCGMDGYVSKPFDEEQLYQAVAEFVASKPMVD